ncbi:MAG: hypothetical protein EBS59_07535 [Verrucomicrobia bacterium]|nr:hypothetical protein [Verrucomicrobiota bacterium]
MKKFPVDISESGIRALLNSPDSYARRFTETSLRALLNYSEIQGTLSNQKNEFPPVPWEMEKLRAKVKSEVSKHIFGWYGETESAAGDSTLLLPPNRGSLVQGTRRHPPKQPHPRFCRTLRSRQQSSRFNLIFPFSAIHLQSFFGLEFKGFLPA